MDISGYGLRANVKASITFPNGFDVTEWADDTDPLDSESIQIRDKAMGLNGDLVTWSKATPLPIAMGVIPNSEADKNLAALFEANRSGKGKTGVRDVVTITWVYPDGSTATFTEGAITDGPATLSVASAGRIKTNVYKFAFENRVITAAA